MPTIDTIQFGDRVEYNGGGDDWRPFMTINSDLDKSQAFGCVKLGIGYRITRNNQVIMKGSDFYS